MYFGNGITKELDWGLSARDIEDCMKGGSYTLK